jgi:hypothetical protein
MAFLGFWHVCGGHLGFYALNVTHFSGAWDFFH